MSLPKARWFGVGINTYPGAPLQGCIEDWKTIKSDLSSRFNSTGWDFQYAINATAKKRNLLQGLINLGKGAVSGQTLVISMSGHGTPQEANGKFQTVFCPYDFDWSTENSLFAVEVLGIIGNYPKGVHLLIIWDSCYSEWDEDDYGTRSIVTAQGEARNIIPRLYPLFNQPDIILKQKDFSGTNENILEKAILSGDIPCCYIPACLTKGVHSAKGETAADVRVNGKAYGAHTHQLSKVWNEVSLETTLENVVNQQRAELEADGYEQHSYAIGTQKGMTLKEFFNL